MAIQTKSQLHNEAILALKSGTSNDKAKDLLTVINNIIDSYQDVNSIIHEVKLDIAAGDVLQLLTTPVELVPAPGAGKAVVMTGVTLLMIYNGSAYATSTDIKVGHLTGEPQFSFTNVLNQTHNIFPIFGTVPDNGYPTQIQENQAINVTSSANPTAGNSDITIYATYRIITL